MLITSPGFTYSRTFESLRINIPNPFEATRYHSLVIDKKSIKNNLELNILAYSEDDNEIMSIKHKKYPVYGLQFHPESILTNVGLILLKNFLNQAVQK